ncbi:YjgF/Yer057p/UK114 family [Aspergillus terreus]|uniref:YjgF/Yer057p/UK114 family n=1 Tax=Aspergillus terreus TaxID=33178 RepID=A0A5M3Z9A5_ASPTE|nr:hypothetical protein ATETN484_0009041800 [Aspergillus terreus]GFF17869.1 YjgF/Yer057p/UK114 family [Aspergillus terreus]
MSNFQFFSTTPCADANSKNFRYSQAVKVGQTVKTSGQGGWDVAESIVPDIEKQVIIAFENVEKALKCVDSQLSWQNVYPVRSYHTKAEETFDIVTANFERVIPSHRPIWTCVEFRKLGIQGILIEIEVRIAILEHDYGLHTVDYKEGSPMSVHRRLKQ